MYLYPIPRRRKWEGEILPRLDAEQSIIIVYQITVLLYKNITIMSEVSVKTTILFYLSNLY